MIYLGIDPGTHRIGYGLIRVEGQQMIPLDYGIIENTGSDHYAHIAHVEQSLGDIIVKYNPVAAGVEKLFFANNRTTAMKVSEMRGVILSSINRHNIAIHEFTPLEVKKSICGYGKADKAQVEHMTRMILGIKEKIKPDDAADALAIAVSCSAAHPGSQLIS